MSYSETLNSSEVSTILDILRIRFKSQKVRKDGWVRIISPIRDDDHDPSFDLNVVKGWWIDYGTGEKGDLVLLVKVMKGFNSEGEAIAFIKENIKTIPFEHLLDYGFQPPAAPHFDLPSSHESNSQVMAKAKESSHRYKDEDVVDEIIQEINATPSAQQRLKEEDHDLILQVLQYDLITKQTLIRYNCGITEEYGSDWLAIHYPGGTQLYRRQEGKKKIAAVKGSRPGDAFFGIEQLNGKGTLLIAKSPREAMMLAERYSDVLDVISIVSGETGSLSAKQAEFLRSKAKRWHTVKVLFDCDTPKALAIARDFTKEVAKALSNRIAIQYVNVWELSNQTCKDLNEYFKTEANPEQVYADILAKGTCIKKRQAKPKDILHRQVDVSMAQSHPPEVYDQLPKTLKGMTDLIGEPYRRDVFLSAALPVMAAHLINVEIPHKDCHYSPDLFCLVIANPGSGKGIAEKARNLGYMLNSHLIADSQKAKAAWEALPKKERERTPAPVMRQLYLPGNSSSRALYDFIKHNSSRGLIFETEIDTLINASRQDWGDFTDVIRKAFHHEPISIQRKGDEMYIERPQLSIFMSGTFDQFRRLFDSAENGHFSRNAFYTFEAPLAWKSHRPTDKSRQLEQLIEECSSVLYQIYHQLKERDNALTIHLEDRHWDQIDRTFQEQMHRLEQERMSRYLQSSNQRSAVIAIRIAAIMCILRNVTEVGMSILDRDELCITDKDLAVGQQMALNFFDHAIRLYQLLPNISKWKAKGTKFETFYYRLPDQFETKQAYYIGLEVQISKRTVRNYLSELVSEGALLREEHGSYSKIDL